MSQNVDHPTDTDRPPKAGTPTTTNTTEPPSQSRDWDPSKTTRDRVYEVAIQLHEPATTSEAATRADCSTDAARQHLDWLAEVGIVARDATRPTTYCRNEAYFEWRRVEGLRRECTRDELRDRLEDLTAAERTYRDRYDAAHPDDVDALEAAAGDLDDSDGTEPHDHSDSDSGDHDSNNADHDTDNADHDTDTADPAPANTDHDLAVHEVWQDLSDWRSTRRELRLLERARQRAAREPSRGARSDGTRSHEAPADD